jgi:predicted DNA-binding protein (MmcQ/YjbR family)
VAKPSPGMARAEAALRAHALAQPQATEHFPWGDRAIKVRGKVFLFMSVDAPGLSLSTKLPASAGVALLLPFAEPTGYGLGKAGWVSASFEPGDQPPVEMLCDWIDESYQAVAPAKLAAEARAGAAGGPADAKPAAATRTTKKPATTKRATKKPATAKRATKKPAAAKRTTNEPATAKRATNKPAAAKRATKQPTRRRG